MGFFKSVGTFMIGSVVGAAAGAATAALTAPSSGDELRETIATRLREAKVAGAEAKSAKEAELVAKYRLTVKSDTALEEHRVQTHADAVSEIAHAGEVPGFLSKQSAS